MICRYHPSAHQDVFEILDYYDSISAELGDAFYNELMDVVGGKQPNTRRDSGMSPIASEEATSSVFLTIFFLNK